MRVLRVLIPCLLIVAWLAVAGVGGPYFGKIDEVSTNDQASYLPASAEATRVAGLTADFAGSDDIPAILVVTAADGGELTEAQVATVSDAFDELVSDLGDELGASSPAILSDDGEAIEFVVPIASEEPRDVVAEIREVFLADDSAFVMNVTGPAGFTADLAGAFAGIDGLLLGVALAAVLVILLIVYRSPLLPLLVLSTAVFALSGAILAVWWLAYAGIVQINGQVQGILFILVIGAATDYALLYTARYREALRDHEKRWDATIAAFTGSLEPILASGGTVIAGLLCLLLSDLNSNKALGPVAAIGIVFSLLAALTLLPALLVAFGRVAFWPLRPTYGSAHPVLVGETAKGLWPRVGRLVAHHARPVWIVSIMLLGVAALGLTQLKADGVPQSELVLTASDARDGQEVLGEHFPAGSGSPAVIVGPEDALSELAIAAYDVDGVESVEVLSGDSPTGTVPVDEDGELGSPFGASAGAASGSDSDSAASGPPAGVTGDASAGDVVLPSFDPTVVDGEVMLRATFDDAPDSAAAEQLILDLRDAVHAVDESSAVGGVTATALDTETTSIRDREVIIPVVLAVILVILMLLLRSVVAPVILIGTVILSFAAALGVAALVFDYLLGFPGADPAVPLYAFVFLVALGVDYNIFLMTRVREESQRFGTREGILRGLAVTGGVITSAGIVLAATFAALGVIPILFLAQLAFIVAFGVLLDTFLVRSLLVPALAHDLGRRIWWPSKLGRREVDEAAIVAARDRAGSAPGAEQGKMES